MSEDVNLVQHYRLYYRKTNYSAVFGCATLNVGSQSELNAAGFTRSYEAEYFPPCHLATALSTRQQQQQNAIFPDMVVSRIYRTLPPFFYSPQASAQELRL